MPKRQRLSYEGGGATLSIVSEILAKHGYTDQEWGYAKDGGAGWSGWHYWIDVNEDPARPVAAEIDAALKTR